MTKTSLGRLLGTSLAALCAGSTLALGQTPDQPADAGEQRLIDPSQIPSVHNTFYKVPDGAISWDVLGRMDVTTEVLGPLRATFHVEYTDEVRALDGQEIKVMGFLYPLEGGLTHERFLLSAWPPSCPFCLPAGPSQMVEVFCAEPVEFSEGAIMMTGMFSVLEDDPSGLYYRMHDARLVERFDDIRWAGELPPQPQAPQYDE